MAKETTSSIDALQKLCNKKVMVVRAIIRDIDINLKKICNHYSIPVCTEEQLLKEKEMIDADYILSFYWKKVRQEVLDISRKGSINFHPGPLPEARGSGYHAAILNNWGYWGVTAHYMDANLDTGDIIKCDRFPISDMIVNKDLVTLTHQKLAVLFEEIIDRMLDGEIPEGVKQDSGAYYSKADLEKNKMVLESESKEEIDRKIRAFWNPPYSGAQIEIAGAKYTLVNEDILQWIAERI